MVFKPTASRVEKTARRVFVLPSLRVSVKTLEAVSTNPSSGCFCWLVVIKPTASRVEKTARRVFVLPTLRVVVVGCYPFESLVKGC